MDNSNQAEHYLTCGLVFQQQLRLIVSLQINNVTKQWPTVSWKNLMRWTSFHVLAFCSSPHGTTTHLIFSCLIYVHLTGQCRTCFFTISARWPAAAVEILFTWPYLVPGICAFFVLFLVRVNIHQTMFPSIFSFFIFHSSFFLCWSHAVCYHCS